ncbi:hypothetical protein E6R61_15715 [Streptomyces sp. LRa12]|uniref:Uncharacterized protein n=1 Tax=Streptomyces coelicolor (strain ATCC BAA-471 / A3(2) / M145) TaxID=100226 RepID=Q9S2V7_STRCO|nr:hypothetical protein FQ762_10710 [Streptomyces coelicolor A3(2)]THA93366.1 hypothetical protein E6R61_15715 [Streptomyces sp. LRa12]CAB52008.1 hypothetical protein [Streptomyces coelicolor A3(2)]
MTGVGTAGPLGALARWVRVGAGLGQDRLEDQHPLHQAQEHRHVAYQVVGVPAARRAPDARLGARPARRAGGEQRAPLGQLGRDLGQHLPGAADAGPGPWAGLRAAARGQHRGGGAQGGEVGRRVALVRRFEGGGLLQPGPGLGEQVEGGGRGGRPAEHGVHVARRSGQ